MTTGWASFGLHPVLMTLAFGLFMPLSALSYRGLERLLGVSHAAAKATHGGLMLVAVILGVLGCSLVLGTWGPAGCTTKGPHGHQVWAMMVWPNKFAEVAAAFVYFGTAGAFKWVPRPSLFTPAPRPNSIPERPTGKPSPISSIA